MKQQIPALILLAGISAAHATPSGLNNIPTADTTPQGTFVVQPFGTVGGNGPDSFVLGFKTGVDLKKLKLELGFVEPLVPGKSGPFTAHVKAAVPLGEGLPTVAVGAANITFNGKDQNRVGDPFAYFVVSHDFHYFRAHAGVGFKDSEGLPFFGVDKTFRVAKRAPASDGKSVRNAGGKSMKAVETEYRDLFMLRADVIQQANRSWTTSAGVLIPVTKWFALETWGSFPTDGSRASATIKGNFVFSF